MVLIWAPSDRDPLPYYPGNTEVGFAPPVRSRGHCECWRRRRGRWPAGPLNSVPTCQTTATSLGLRRDLHTVPSGMRIPGYMLDTPPTALSPSDRAFQNNQKPSIDETGQARHVPRGAVPGAAGLRPGRRLLEVTTEALAHFLPIGHHTLGSLKSGSQVATGGRTMCPVPQLPGRTCGEEMQHHDIPQEETILGWRGPCQGPPHTAAQ